MRLGPAQLVVGRVCVHDHLVMFEQPQTVTTTPMSGHELDTHSIDTVTVAGHRMSYHEYVPGDYYGLKYRAPQKRYLVTVLGLQLLISAVNDLFTVGPGCHRHASRRLAWLLWIP